MAKPTDPQRLAGRLQAALIALAAAMFGAFFLIGYDNAYEADDRFIAPRLTDTLLLFCYALAALAAIAAIASAIHGIRTHAFGEKETNGIAGARIIAITAALLAATLAATFALASTEPLTVNGETYADELWLRLSDMLINTAIVLGIAAAGAALYGASGLNRR